jgi:hypothetical protein
VSGSFVTRPGTGQQVEAAESSSIYILIRVAHHDFPGLEKKLNAGSADLIRTRWLQAGIHNDG